MSKPYNVIKSEWPTEIAIVDRVETEPIGPKVSTEGIGSPIDAPMMLLPGIYAVPPIGSKVEFTQTDEGPVAGMMVSWPDEDLQKIAEKAAQLPRCNPGELLLFSPGALIKGSDIQYIHIKTDGSITVKTMGEAENEMTINKAGIAIKTDKVFKIEAQKFYVSAQNVTIP